ncbi:MAG: acyltransferase family protein [Sporichthyaceae bacterium]
MARDRLAYRPALDGLRAVAVLSVMLYHGQVGWLPGGFLGVDVFFVLSGFLITSLLLLEWRTWRSIDLATFWLHRARRLLPALFLVLVAATIFSAATLPSDRLGRFRGDAVATLFYVANWRFAATGQSYFDQFQDPSPLLHMWSLGIEEQFYWAFPLALLLWLRVRRNSRGLTLAFLVGAVASALAMAVTYRTGADPSRVYYGTDTRAQALLVGAALAAWQGRHRRASGAPAAVRLLHPRVPITASDLLGLPGLAGLAALLLGVHESDPWLYRGGFLLVALASGSVVAASRDRGSITSRVLGWEPLRLGGVISYGLYLWHWPVFLFLSPDRTGLTELPLLAARLVTTVLIAAASYVVLENPIRRGVLRRRFRPVVRRLVPVAATLTTVAVVLQGTSGATAAPSIERSGTYETRINQAAPGQLSVLLAGDSPGRFLGWYFPTDQHHEIALSTSTVIGCGLLPQNLVIDGVATPPQPQCNEWRHEFARAATAAHPDVVVLSTGAWELYDHEIGGKVFRVGTPDFARALEKRYDEAITALAGRTTPVALLNVPCFNQASWTVNGVDLAPDHNDPTRQEWLNTVLQRVAARHPDQVRVVDLRGLLCPSTDYQPTIDGVDVRPDGVHVAGPGGALVWRWLAPQLPQIAGLRQTSTAFLVGDSVAFNLRENQPRDSALKLTGSTKLGCGLTPAAVSYQGVRKPPTAGCVAWSRDWPDDVAPADPDVGLVMLGTHEQWDHVVAGRTLPFGSLPFAQNLRQTLDRAVRPFTRLGTPVAISNVPCHQLPDPGTIPDAKVTNDKQRISWLNDFARDYGEKRGIPVIDLYSYLCSDGYHDTLNGVTLRVDGVHFSEAGAHLVWHWLEPQLLRLASHSSS